ncbi:hypothetical protein F3Y22_tig00016725pilonHSYRG00014 [Hibiscus syriacus]|uniref:Uncharacterized protein n=1 Tax=Hibiscus syriacus TaxID=106335 RepID=A0A6A3BWJ6_HIBSY|nr:hypothetical protein F3Y22_tig00016725pilonHSYRG00014 [Hibiscus syriacus]
MGDRIRLRLVGSVSSKQESFSAEILQVAGDGLSRVDSSSEEKEVRSSGGVGSPQLPAENSRDTVDRWLVGDVCTTVAGGSGSKHLMLQEGEGQPSGAKLSGFSAEDLNFKEDYRGLGLRNVSINESEEAHFEGSSESKTNNYRIVPSGPAVNLLKLGYGNRLESRVELAGSQQQSGSDKLKVQNWANVSADLNSNLLPAGSSQSNREYDSPANNLIPAGHDVKLSRVEVQGEFQHTVLVDSKLENSDTALSGYKYISIEGGFIDRLQSQSEGISNKPNKDLLEEVVLEKDDCRGVGTELILERGRSLFQHRRTLCPKSLPIERRRMASYKRYYTRSRVRIYWFENKHKGIPVRKDLQPPSINMVGGKEEVFNGAADDQNPYVAPTNCNSSSEVLAVVPFSAVGSGRSKRREKRVLTREAVDMVNSPFVFTPQFSKAVEEAMVTWEVCKILGISFKDGKKAFLDKIINLEEGSAESREHGKSGV